MTQHTSRLCLGYFTMESDGMLHQMTWPPQSTDLNQVEVVWDESDRSVKKKQSTSAQRIWELLQDCWKSGLPSGAVVAVPLEILVRVQALSQPAMTESLMGRSTIGPASSGLGEGLASMDVLVPLHTSDSCGGPGAMHADTVARCTVFPPTHWCSWLPG
jgi:hypothetical protein